MEKEEIREAKKFSLETKINAVQQLILKRYESLTILSSIAFAIAGIIMSDQQILFPNLRISLEIFVFVSLVSFTRFLFLIRSDVNGIWKQINELPEEDWSKSLKEDQFDLDYWPEVLFFLFAIGVINMFYPIFCI